MYYVMPEIKVGTYLLDCVVMETQDTPDANIAKMNLLFCANMCPLRRLFCAHFFVFLHARMLIKWLQTTWLWLYLFKES